MKSTTTTTGCDLFQKKGLKGYSRNNNKGPVVVVIWLRWSLNWNRRNSFNFHHLSWIERESCLLWRAAQGSPITLLWLLVLISLQEVHGKGLKRVKRVEWRTMMECMRVEHVKDLMLVLNHLPRQILVQYFSCINRDKGRRGLIGGHEYWGEHLCCGEG